MEIPDKYTPIIASLEKELHGKTIKAGSLVKIMLLSLEIFMYKLENKNDKS